MRNKMIAVPLLVALLVSLVSPVLVQGAVTSYSEVGQTGGVTNAVVLSEGQLYFNIGPRIVKMAVPDGTPGSPTLPGTYGGILPGVPVDIKVANGFVYVAMGRDGVAVVDGTTLQPVGTQELPAGGNAVAVAVGPSRLYVAAGNDGIVSYGLGADNKTLTYAATKTFAPVRNVTDVETRLNGGTFLYAAANNYTDVLADRGGIALFDVTSAPDPGTPTGNAAEIDINALALGASAVYAAGDTAFYALNPGSLAMSGTVALANMGVQLAARPSGGYLYLTSGAGIDVVDVTNPAAPVVATASPLLTNGFAAGLAAGQFMGGSDTFLYVADNAAGLSIVTWQLATPQKLSLASQSYVMPRPAGVSAVAGAGTQGFAFSNDMLWTIDAAVPAGLNIVGAGIAPAVQIRSLTVYNNLLLASADLDGLLRYQINPGAELSALGTFSTGGAAYASAVVWPNAVVADGANGLTVVNIDGAMSLVGNAPVPDVSTSSFEQVDVKGTMAYVYDIDGHLRIYDLTTPASPVAKGVLAQAGVLDLKVSGDYAFLACGADGVKVVNIANPDAPAFVAGADYATLGSAEGLALSGSNLIIAERGDGVEIVAIAPAGTLSAVASANTSGSALRVALGAGEVLFAADDNGGFAAIAPAAAPVEFKIFLPMVLRG